MEDDHQLDFDVDQLRQYFRYLFPSTGMFKWLTYYQPAITEDDKKDPFSDYFFRREFSLTLEGDIYVRYNCFRNEKEFKDHLVDQSPIKIDIGAVYNIPPRNHGQVESRGGFVPLEKEMIFDIDMTDYDDVRTCCSGANCCTKCWRFMVIAVRVLDRALREDFGFQQLLWVFSGRRGVHCWVCDAETRKLNNEARSALTNYLSVHVGNEMTSATANVELPIHPALDRAKEIMAGEFEEIMMREQNILADEGQRKKLMDMMITTKSRSILENTWNDNLDENDPENSAKLWKIFKKVVETENPNPNKDLIASAMFTYIYPRLDANVSKGINHLLKSPFCVHPKTGKICVPFDPEKVDEFDPTDCPTLRRALNEYDDLLNSGANARSVVPCMQESIRVFNNFLKGLKDEYTTITSKQTTPINPMQISQAF